MTVKVIMTAPHGGHARGEIVEADPGIADAWVNWAFVAMYPEDARKILAKLDAEAGEKSNHANSFEVGGRK